MTKDSTTPEPEIRIDKEGNWYYRGAEMFRKDIVNMLYRRLTRDGTGRYLIEFENERSYPDVEDTPFVIKAIYRSLSETGEDVIYLRMPDESMEKLDPATLRVGPDNSLYCTIAGTGFEARFSRAGYYQIAEFIEYESEDERYYISLNSQRYYINRR
jgi:hypothetical protein